MEVPESTPLGETAAWHGSPRRSTSLTTLAIIRSWWRIRRLATPLTDKSVQKSGVLSIHTPCPPFCDVIFVLKLNYGSVQESG